MAEILFPKELDEANEGNSVGGSRGAGSRGKRLCCQVSCSERKLNSKLKKLSLKPTETGTYFKTLTLIR